MTEPADRALLGAMAALERALARTGRPHMLIGGLAVIARGVPRHTDDVDATIWAPGLELAHLIDELAAERIIGRIPDLEDFARRAQVLLLVHEPSATPMEVTLAWLPFEQAAIARAETLGLGDVVLPVARAEDLVVYKAVAGRPRDREDLEQLVRRHGDDIDRERVRAIVREFAQALEDSDPAGLLESVFAAVDGLGA